MRAEAEAVPAGERIEGSAYTLLVRPSGESQTDGVASAVMNTFLGVYKLYWLVRRRSHRRVYHLFASGAHH